MRKMRQFTDEEFQTEIMEHLPAFISNMKSLGKGQDSFPAWCETFMAWMEVGTDMEEMCWGYEAREE